MRRLIFLFVKHPTPGKVKTRVAADAGAESATALYRVLAEENVAMLRRLVTSDPAWQVCLYATPVEQLGRVTLWLNDGRPPVLDAMPQPDAPLGARLDHAMTWGFGKLGADQVFMVGADCPELSGEVLDRAAGLLANHDAVIGPALDGGFYLLGLSRAVAGAFEGVPWSDHDTASVQRHRLTALGAAVAPPDALPRLRDIDTVADVAALDPAVLARLRARATHTGITCDLLG